MLHAVAVPDPCQPALENFSSRESSMRPMSHPMDITSASPVLDRTWSVEWVQGGRRVRLILRGVIDDRATDAVDIDAVLTESVEQVDIDVSEVTFIDHVGMALVLGLQARARELGAMTADTTEWPPHNPLFAPTEERRSGKLA